MISLEEAKRQTLLERDKALHRAGGGLNQITAYLTQSTGQLVRTHLLLLAAMDEQGFIPAAAPRVAAGIELLHCATLLHDDVIDDAPIRRGIASVQSKFGKKNAIIAGDYLLCLALNQLSGLSDDDGDMSSFNRLLPHFSKALMALCAGEFEQHRQSGNINLSLFSYLRIIRGKTAALFYLSAYLGALLAKESDKNCKALARFGRCVGIIFQILDDCKDYELDQLTAGKPVASDLKNGVITLPLILALKEQPELATWAKEVLAGGGYRADLVATVQAGGLKKARALASRYRDKALLSLRYLNSVKKENLTVYLTAGLGHR